MRRTQLIALLLVVIMAVATIPAIAAREIHPAPATQQTPTVTAKRTPTLTATSTPQWPVRGQRYVVGGSLRGWVSDYVIGLSNRPIQVWRKYPSQTTYTYWKSVNTDKTGRYSFTDSEAGQRAKNYMIKYAGDSVYYAKTTYKTVSIGATTTSLYSTNYYPLPNKEFVIYGFVKDSYGHKLANQPVRVYWRAYYTDRWGSWISLMPTSTDANGKYISTQMDWEKVQYYVVFAGYPYKPNVYWSSQSRAITVDAS